MSWQGLTPNKLGGVQIGWCRYDGVNASPFPYPATRNLVCDPNVFLLGGLQQAGPPTWGYKGSQSRDKPLDGFFEGADAR